MTCQKYGHPIFLTFDSSRTGELSQNKRYFWPHWKQQSQEVWENGFTFSKTPKGSRNRLNAGIADYPHSWTQASDQTFSLEICEGIQIGLWFWYHWNALVEEMRNTWPHGSWKDSPNPFLSHDLPLSALHIWIRKFELDNNSGISGKLSLRRFTFTCQFSSLVLGKPELRPETHFNYFKRLLHSLHWMVPKDVDYTCSSRDHNLTNTI